MIIPDKTDKSSKRISSPSRSPSSPSESPSRRPPTPHGPGKGRPPGPPPGTPLDRPVPRPTPREWPKTDTSKAERWLRWLRRLRKLKPGIPGLDEALESNPITEMDRQMLEELRELSPRPDTEFSGAGGDFDDVWKSESLPPSESSRSQSPQGTAALHAVRQRLEKTRRLFFEAKNPSDLVTQPWHRFRRMKAKRR